MLWSLPARDLVVGAAVATRFFAVGALCIDVDGDVTALATQALINPMYAVHDMALLRDGAPPGEVVPALRAADAGRERRQLHVLDAQGRVAQHTGAGCVD